MKRWLLQNRLTGWVALRPLLWWGYRRFLRTGRTPTSAYQALRKLHYLSDGAVGRALAARVARESAPLAIAPRDGLLDRPHAYAEALSRLRKDGIAVLRDRLPAEQCDALTTFALATEARLVPRPRSGASRARFAADAPLAPRYQFDEEQLVECASVQELLGDPSLLALAQDYLGAPPVCDLITMWWSAAVEGGPSSEAAQLFHFDMDRISFLKLFVYLTDVDASTGPHVYVRGSHVETPRRFRQDRRFTDEEVSEHFGDRLLEVEGPRGTVFLADTSGLHKGKPPARGARLVLQLEWATSLFGQSYQPIPRPARRAAPFERALASWPSIFRRFT